MLLPSALPCDGYSRPSPSSCAYLPSPPLSSPSSPGPTTNIQTSCHALQSLLATSNSAYPPRSSIATPPGARQLQSPKARRPLLESPIAIKSSVSKLSSRVSSRSRPPVIQSPIVLNPSALNPASQSTFRARPPLIQRSIAANAPARLSLRARQPVLRSPIAMVSGSEDSQPRPRGANKRRRSFVEEFDYKSDSRQASTPPPQENLAPSTPKRRRLFPPSLPRGLERADFDALQSSLNETETGPATASRNPCCPCCFSASRYFPSNDPTTRPSQQPIRLYSPPSPDVIREEVSGVFCGWSETAETEAFLLALIQQKLRLRQYDWRERARWGVDH